jgi:hypothetical protein
MAHYRKRKKYYKRTDYGRYKAEQHVREAKELSEMLGGTDEDVKDYFFNLQGAQLKKILDEYEKQNGKNAREYAEFAISRWKSGKRRMSGLVAGRLYKLLPNYMPLESKYNLVETLWKKYCPKSDTTYRIGPDVPEEEVMSRLTALLNEKVVEYTVPGPLENRFRWLAAGDSVAYQKLLNYFLGREKKLVADGLRMRLPTIFREIRDRDTITQSITQRIELGEHKVNLIFDPKTDGIKEGVEAYQSEDSNVGCIVAVVVFIIIVIILKNL